MSTADEPTADSTPADVESTAVEPESKAVEETDESATVEKAVAPARTRRFPLPVVAVAAAYATVFGLVIGLGWPLWQQHRISAAETAGRQAAVDYAQVLTSIDSNKVDDDFSTVLNGATGEFKDTYTKASVQLRQLLIDNKATAQGTVVESAVQSGSKDTVVVLLMVNQTITNTTRPDPRVDRTRMKMTMQKVDGRWLASKVELP
ncbi:Mce protein [Mycolicibacter heraklionensis]|uniref:Mce protein n=1 Tax=Mycolicibacter heraklionensis TaxID=512402 RepID=UPI0007F01CFF|nr:Mce protein [Mycolicibacter heraklionensis]OBJ33613.1 Mce protein [Mycolicibacter heraklionensis]